MIPTRLKAKLPPHLSYPIGAQRISDALAGVPHADELSLTFWAASESRRLLAEQLPYAVVVARFRPARKPGYVGSNAMVDAGFFDERWEIEVGPVLRQHRHVAQQLLEQRGMPAIARWLTASSRRGWTSQGRNIRLVFDALEGSLVAEENEGTV